VISLKVNKLSKSYDRPLLDDLSLSHTGRGVVALIGDNGSGKSTLLKILSGQEEQESGQIQWSWEPRIGYLEQEIDSLPELSGGQKKLAHLADLIYSNLYDVLLLDEPDNHLDMDNKEWLAQAIESFHGLIIIISHDRHLLKRVTTHTWLVEDKIIRTYPFGYKKFQQVYEQELVDQGRLFHVQSKEQARLKELVERFRNRAASGPKAARYYHALQKRLARYEADMVQDPSKKTAKISLTTQTSAKKIHGKMAIIVSDMTFGYTATEPIFQQTELYIEAGDRIALLSPNGTGKSTLIKLLLGGLTPQSGIAKTGDNLKVGYYSQDHLDTLPKDSTPLECLTQHFPIHDYQAEAILRRFFFAPGTMRSKIWTLSGGQKARLQLAIFLNGNPDLLILDEPTNHLDLKSVSSLEDFLRDYDGTVLLISHDRELVSHTCDIIYAIQDGKIELCPVEL
jgi:ATP-binding cassette, subfamily F, member 3